MYFTTQDNLSSAWQAYKFEESEPTTLQNVLSTSELPEPQYVLDSVSTTQQPVLLTHEDLMKFAIGLALLGEKKRQRYLTYLQKLRDETQPSRRRGTTNAF